MGTVHIQTTVSVRDESGAGSPHSCTIVPKLPVPALITVLCGLRSQPHTLFLSPWHCCPGLLRRQGHAPCGLHSSEQSCQMLEKFLKQNFLVSVTWCPSLNPKAGLLQVPGMQATGQPDVARVQGRNWLLLSFCTVLRCSSECCDSRPGCCVPTSSALEHTWSLS